MGVVVIGESVTRQRAVTTSSRYGDSDPDWSDPAEETIEGCAIAPSTTSEDHDGRTAVIQGWTLYAPPDADILAADRIVARGTTFEVDGQPGAWIDPYSGREQGVEVPLRVVTG